MHKALITGVTGMVGSHLVDYLLRETDWDIWGFTRWNSRTDNINHLIHRINADERLHLINGELTDAISVHDAFSLIRPDYVFHLGAQSYPQTSFHAPANYVDANTKGTLYVLDAVRAHCREALVHVCSSSEVYGKVNPRHLPITEDCPFNPASPYSISKVGADLFAQHYAKAYRMRVLITRMFTHTGARRGDVFAESSFAKQIAMIEAGQQDPVIRHGNLGSRRTVADVRDTVRAYHMLLTVNPQPGEVYNIGGFHTCTVGDMLDTLKKLSGVAFERAVDETRMRPIDADLQVPDISKFVNHTGWQPEYTYEQTMAALLDYWRERVKTQEFLIR